MYSMLRTFVSSADCPFTIPIIPVFVTNGAPEEPGVNSGTSASIQESASGRSLLMAPLIAAFVTSLWGWQAAFYVTGLIGFVWVAFWWAIYRAPEEHPKVSAAELAYIHSDQDVPAKPIAWARLLRYPGTWTYIIGAVLTNPVFLWGYAHVLLASLVTGAAVMLAVSAWQLRRGGEREVFGRSARLALIVLVPAMIFAMLIGSELGVIEARYQPMKIAAAEAQWTTCQPCSFSLFQVGGGSQDQTPTQILQIPHLLSLLATNSWNGKVTGLSTLQAQYSRRYGPGNYVPNVFIQYWSMRVMAYTAVLVFLVGAWGLWLTRRKKLATSRWFLHAATWAVVLPFGMNTAGWLLTESGRQPWIVQGIMLTRNGISPSVSIAALAISLAIFVLLYVTLGVVDLLLMLRYSRKELPAPVPEGDEHLPIPAVQY